MSAYYLPLWEVFEQSIDCSNKISPQLPAGYHMRNGAKEMKISDRRDVSRRYHKMTSVFPLATLEKFAHDVWIAAAHSPPDSPLRTTWGLSKSLFGGICDTKSTEAFPHSAKVTLSRACRIGKFPSKALIVAIKWPLGARFIPTVVINSDMLMRYE